MKEHTKEELEKTLNTELYNAYRAEEGDMQSPRMAGLTPLALFDFQGLHDDAEPGRIVHMADDELDIDKYKDDVLTITSMYQEATIEQPSTAAAMRYITEVLFEAPRKRDTILHTYDNFEDVGTAQFTVHDGFGALAAALQAEFDFNESCGFYALFTIHDAISLAAQQISMRWKKDKKQRDARLLPLDLIRPEYAVPIPSWTSGSPAFVPNYVIEVLKSTGVMLLHYLFFSSENHFTA